MRRSALDEETVLDRQIEKVRLGRSLATMGMSDLGTIFAMVLTALSFAAGVTAAIFGHALATVACLILVIVFGLRASGATSLSSEVGPKRVCVQADFEVLSPPPVRGKDVA